MACKKVVRCVFYVLFRNFEFNAKQGLYQPSRIQMKYLGIYLNHFLILWMLKEV